MRILGVIGGMGPEATVDFLKKLVELTLAERDQDHIHTIVDCYPQIPNRTEAIVGAGPSPLPHLVESGRRLVACGAELIVIPCNTAHYWLGELREAVGVPVLNMIEATVLEFLRRFPGARSAGVVATLGAVQAGLYQQELAKHGISPVIADPEVVMEAVRSVKSGDVGRAREIVSRLIGELRPKVDAVIIGCSDLSAVVDWRAEGVVDSNYALAKAAVIEVVGRVRAGDRRSPK